MYTLAPGGGPPGRDQSDLDPLRPGGVFEDDEEDVVLLNWQVTLEEFQTNVRDRDLHAVLRLHPEPAQQ